MNKKTALAILALFAWTNCQKTDNYNSLKSKPIEPTTLAATSKPRAISFQLGVNGKYTAVFDKNGEGIVLKPTDISFSYTNLSRTCLYGKGYRNGCTSGSKKFVMQKQDKRAIQDLVNSHNYLSKRIKYLNNQQNKQSTE